MTAARLPVRILIGILRFSVPVAIIVAALMGGQALLSQRPEVPRTERAPQALAVETIGIDRGSARAVTTAFGTVQPRRQLVVRPQVAGRIESIHPDLISGGSIDEDEILFTIERTEYLAAVIEAESALARAEFDLAVEEGRAAVARAEWELLDDTVRSSADGGRLARREPHLIERAAAIEAAKARLDRARLNLDRTTVRAPFNCTVLEESLEIGQIVTAQTAAATLIGIDAFHVRTSVPVDGLSLITLPGPSAESAAPAATARVLHDTGGATPAVLPGRVVRLLGDVDPAGRMARLLVEVDDPLCREPETSAGRKGVPLLVGEFVRVELEGPVRDDVVTLPRRAVREGDEIWLMTGGGTLELRTVEPLWGTTDAVVVNAGGFTGQERIVISPIAAPVPGMPLVDVAGGA